MTEFDRRRFIGMSAGAIAWAACGKSKPNARATPHASAALVPKNLSLSATSVELAKGDDRTAFAIFNGPSPYAPKKLSIELIPPAGKGPLPEISRERIGRGIGGSAGVDQTLDLFVVRAPFDVPGIWTAKATVPEGTAEATFEVINVSPSPMVGAKALATLSPTTSDGRGVKPICTRDPVCSMHALTVADAIKSAKPSVLLFVTPRFCQSRTCGPILDILETLKPKFADTNFVHIEVYKDTNAKDLAPAMTEWAVAGEPWIVFVDAAGIVVARWSGAIGPNELKAALEALNSGKPI